MTESRRVAVFTGHRDITDGHKSLIEAAVSAVCAEVDEFVVGGARGADTIALAAAIDYCLNNTKSPDLVIVVPNRAADQPYDARAVIGRAVIEADAKIVEMLERYTPDTLKARNRKMVDRIEGDGFVLAYWRQIYRSGTYSAIKYAKDIKNIPIRSILPEYPL